MQTPLWWMVVVDICKIGRINNPEARALLKLQDKDAALVSKLFKSIL
jgi:hypothetical protein